MDLEAFLDLHGATLDEVTAGAQRLLPPEPGDRLIAVGSLAEGLGNRKSDVDLLLVTARGDQAAASPDEVRSFVVGQCIIDLRIVPATLAESLHDRLTTWARSGWNVTVAADFTANELLLLHRLNAGRQLWPDRAEASREIAAVDPAIARLKLHVARHMARTLQVDMVGYQEAGDPRSLVFAAQDLLGHAVDGLLAGFHLTNPTLKWRSRLLEHLPADWDARLHLRRSGMRPSEIVWGLHRAPETATAESALAHAGRVTAFARAAFLMAEERLIHGDADAGRGSPEPEGAVGTGHPRPLLHLDVDFCRTADGVAVGRLNEFGSAVLMSRDEFAMVLLLDQASAAGELAAMRATGASDDRWRRLARSVRDAGLGLPVDSETVHHRVDLAPSQ